MTKYEKIGKMVVIKLVNFGDENESRRNVYYMLRKMGKVPN